MTANTVKVNPSGDKSGNTDTSAINSAFSAAGTTKTVELTGGTFYINGITPPKGRKQPVRFDSGGLLQDKSGGYHFGA